MYLKPSNIFYSHNSITSTFGRRTAHSNKSIGDTLDDLCNGRLKISDIKTIEVTKKEDKWYTLDNRRLWIFHHLEAAGKCSEIPVIVKHYSASPSWKFTSNNGGTSVSIYKGRSPGGSWYRRINPVTPRVEEKEKKQIEPTGTDTKETKNIVLEVVEQGNDTKGEVVSNDTKSTEITVSEDKNIGLVTVTTAETLPSSCSADTLPSSCSADTLPSSCNADTLPSLCSADTLPSSCSADTLPSSCSADTLPSSCSADTLPSSYSSSRLSNTNIGLQSSLSFGTKVVNSCALKLSPQTYLGWKVSPVSENGCSFKLKFTKIDGSKRARLERLKNASPYLHGYLRQIQRKFSKYHRLHCPNSLYNHSKDLDEETENDIEKETFSESETDSIDMTQDDRSENEEVYDSEGNDDSKEIDYDDKPWSDDKLSSSSSEPDYDALDVWMSENDEHHPFKPYPDSEASDSEDDFRIAKALEKEENRIKIREQKYQKLMKKVNSLSNDRQNASSTNRRSSAIEPQPSTSDYVSECSTDSDSSSEWEDDDYEEEDKRVRDICIRKYGYDLFDSD